MCLSRGGGGGGVAAGGVCWVICFLRPIKWGFAFESVPKETDEPAKLHDFPPV